MRKPLTLVAALILLAFTLVAQADIFVTIEGIKGNSFSKGHPGAINALRYNLEITAPNDAAIGSGAGAATGKIFFKPLIITKEPDAASAQLLHALLEHEAFKFVSLELVKPDAKGMEFAYFTVKMKLAVISSIHQYTDDHGQNLEDITISYAAIEFEPAGASAPPASPEGPVIRIPLRNLNK